MQVQHFERLHLRFGNLRLLIVIATLIAAWFSFYRDAFSPWWLLLSLPLFLVIAVLHAKVLRNRSCAERAVSFYRNGLVRIEDRWADSDKPGTGQTAERIDIHSSLYATDLDLFGPASLFELLSLARTRMGEDTLAAWLLSPSPVREITQRHTAVDELRSCLDLREDIAILGEDIKVGIHPDALTQWAEAPNQLPYPWLRWLSLALAIAAIAAAIVRQSLGQRPPSSPSLSPRPSSPRLSANTPPQFFTPLSTPSKICNSYHLFSPGLNASSSKPQASTLSKRKSRPIISLAHRPSPACEPAWNIFARLKTRSCAPSTYLSCM